MNSLLPILVAVSFAAGLNVYATVATLGLIERFGLLPLPPELHLLSSNFVIGASLTLFAVELVADKIPYFDLVWNALHTFIRVPVAALVAYGATAHLSPAVQAAATLMGALLALAAHGGKTAARAAVSASPEPFTNIALSFGEDVLAVWLTWFAVHHPWMAATLVLAFTAAIAALVRRTLRWVRALPGASGERRNRAMSKRTASAVT